jgi:hypothetical protein
MFEKCSKMFENVRKMFENVRKCSKMFEKCSKMFENVRKCSKMFEKDLVRYSGAAGTSLDSLSGPWTAIGGSYHSAELPQRGAITAGTIPWLAGAITARSYHNGELSQQ